MNKYQEAFNEVKEHITSKHHWWSTQDERKHLATLQELVDKETPMTPTFKNTKVEREHYLDKDYQMLYHCPKCDWIINPVREYCEHCGQKLDWNKYYIVEGNTYYKRNE